MGRLGHEVARPRARALQRLHQPRGDGRGGQLEAVAAGLRRVEALEEAAARRRRGGARPSSPRAARNAGWSCGGRGCGSAPARSGPRRCRCPEAPAGARRWRPRGRTCSPRRRRARGRRRGRGPRRSSPPARARPRASPASRRLVRSIWPKRLVSKIARKAARGRSSTAPGMAKAPLLTSASIRPPVRASASSTAAARPASSARSSGRLSSPSARSRAQSSGLRQVASTRQPRARRVRAASRPIPDEQPVMRTLGSEAMDGPLEGVEHRRRPAGRRRGGAGSSASPPGRAPGRASRGC